MVRRRRRDRRRPAPQHFARSDLVYLDLGLPGEIGMVRQAVGHVGCEHGQGPFDHPDRPRGSVDVQRRSVRCS